MSSSFKHVLEKIAGEKAPGPSQTFSVFHILRALEIIAKKSPGRGKLAKDLDVGEGAVRTLIGRLKDFGLVVTSKSGCSLTNEGLRLWKEVNSVFESKAEIGRNEFSLADCNVALLIKNCGHKVKLGVEQRDAAIVVGAKGAITIMVKQGCLVIPSVSKNVDKDFPKAATQVRKLEPEENDVIVIGSADSLAKAEYGALAAAWTLIED